MIYENDLIYIEVQICEIPWLKIFAKKECKEMSECDEETKDTIYKALDFIEKEMIEYFKPDKINIASFGNYVSQVHWHIMARFKEDSYFPEPMWGKKQRDGRLNLPDFEKFLENLKKKLEGSL